MFLYTLNTILMQCAMCKAVVESGGKDMAEGINNGIVFLMVIPYVLFFGVGYLIYRFYRV